MNKYLGFFRTISFVLMLSFCIMMLVGCNKGDISPQPATEAPEQGTADAGTDAAAEYRTDTRGVSRKNAPLNAVLQLR